MSIILFIIVLALLILVHEFGHFIVAKASGMRVDEFAIGFPPRLFTKKYGETNYSINAIPAGGYVSIHGENPDQESMKGEDSERSFTNQPKYRQALVLVAGVTFNILFAWLLFSIGFMAGLPAQENSLLVQGEKVENAALTITGVLDDSPANEAGFEIGDTISSLSSGEDTLTENLSPEAVSGFIETHEGAPLSFSFERDGNVKTSVVRAQEELTEGEGPMVGISMAMIGTVQFNPLRAISEGLELTGELLSALTVGLAQFFGSIFTGSADFSQVAGPVGIVGLVGNASEIGFVYLMFFTGFISLNLAIINLIPFPALDGGRLLFVLIEKIKGSQISPKVANTVNAVGFVILILLMIVITYNDVIKLF